MQAAETMKAVVITTPGDPEVLQLQEVEDPDFNDDEVLIKVAATALNRTDTLQRKGSYPLPEGASPYPGVECSGIIEAVGKNVSRWKIGDQTHVLQPRRAHEWNWKRVLNNFQIHGGSSGIGTFAIQIAKYQGARVFVTAGSEEKLAACKELGADVGINYKTEDFVARVKEETGGKGVDVILDNIGGPYLQKNLDSLNVGGRLFIIGFMGGTGTQVNLGCLLARRLTVQAAGLRSRSTENKAVIVKEVEKNVWPAIAAGKVKPVVYKYLPLAEAAEGHRLMESGQHVGKILLVT